MYKNMSLRCTKRLNFRCKFSPNFLFWLSTPLRYKAIVMSNDRTKIFLLLLRVPGTHGYQDRGAWKTSFCGMRLILGFPCVLLLSCRKVLTTKYHFPTKCLIHSTQRLIHVFLPPALVAEVTLLVAWVGMFFCLSICQETYRHKKQPYWTDIIG